MPFDAAAMNRWTHIGVMIFATVITFFVKIYVNDGGTTPEEQYAKGMGDRFLQQKASEPEVYRLYSGLLFKIHEKGSGALIPSIDTPVDFHYEGSFINGTVFDSSYARDSPLQGVTPKQVIAGWMQALCLMRAGDVWTIYVDEKLAYGARGLGTKIAPYTTLVFKLELLRIVDEKKALTAERIDKGNFIRQFGRPYELL